MTAENTDTAGEHWNQSGGVCGPDGAVSHYVMTYDDPDTTKRGVITFGSEDRPGASSMYLDELRHALHYHYHVDKPKTGWRTRDSFSNAEKTRLRPVAETLAMLDGNAFFGLSPEGVEHYEYYLPEASALYQGSGGDTGWGGRATLGAPVAQEPVVEPVVEQSTPEAIVSTAPLDVVDDYQGWSLDQEFDADPLRDDESVAELLRSEAARLGILFSMDKSVMRAALVAALPFGRGRRAMIALGSQDPAFLRYQPDIPSGIEKVAESAKELSPAISATDD